MNTFKHFPASAVCPMCNTNEDKECILISIDSTGDGSICQAQPFHVDCIKIDKMHYQEKTGILYTWCTVKNT